MQLALLTNFWVSTTQKTLCCYVLRFVMCLLFYLRNLSLGAKSEIASDKLSIYLPEATREKIAAMMSRESFENV